MGTFTHLHVHTQYSILDGAAGIKQLIARTKELNMDSIAITDHGNMFGVLEFHNECREQGIKPILGCEMYVTPYSRFIKDGKHFSGHHLILLAKNETGYKNLIKLDSLAFAKDAKYRTSRIDKELLFSHSEGLICCSACLGGIVPKLITAGNIEEAEKTVLEYKSVFKDDYYLELQDHGLDLQKLVMTELVRMSKKYDVKLVATNDVHFINADDFEAHRILICLNTGKTLSEDTKLMYTGNEYLKSPEEMSELFKDYPDSISNSQEIANKVEIYKLTRDPILPIFDIPKDFGTIEEYKTKYSEKDIKAELYEEFINNPKTCLEDKESSRKEEITNGLLKKKGGYEKIVRTKFDAAYLRHLTLDGAKKRYGEPLPEKTKERIESELKTIEWMGFPGYFLIVQDFINYSRNNLGVIVGPGRGSAAGSVVAYCLGITNIDPLKYELLFERFLNPDRISLPDIDVDFDNEGRAKVLDYVQKKYGADHVAQITTFGTMAAKLSIKDVARVLELPLNTANRLAKLVPNKPGITLKKAFEESPELKTELEKGEPLVQKVLLLAQKLEGSIRNTGTHACGVIIGPDDISNYVPLADIKDSDMMATQFEGKLIESVGMIKMDFLGLKNLSIIKDACEIIKSNRNIDINPDEIPLDDKKTFELYQKGMTLGTFQFESEGMSQHLKNLKPDKFEDLIAMNALYRPGPMQYIPKFINRKHGIEEITYEIPVMSKYLSETYGITVYQEQVMLLSQALAGFTPGEADKLRKAMGKKKKDVMQELKEKFITGCLNNKLDKNKIEKIWQDWEKFAEYAFNKSHSTCYAYIAFQTAYLKANYPAEYMSSLLTHNLNDISTLTRYIDECHKMGLKVLGPNINESNLNFAVNKKNEIIFGLAGIKNVGSTAAAEIIKEREENGPFSSPLDFLIRLNQKNINRRCVESLIKSGALDCFGNIHRAQYFFPIDNNGNTIIDRLIKLTAKIKENRISSQNSLFGEEINEEICMPEMPECEQWSNIERQNYEKEMIGFYISGHPLDSYKTTIKTFANTQISELSNLENLKDKEICLAGIITEAANKTSKTGKAYSEFSIEDQSGNYNFKLFGKDYVSFSDFCKSNLYVMIKATVTEKLWNKDSDNELMIKIKRIELLEDFLQKFAKNISLKINYKDISNKLVNELEQIFKQSKGTTPVMIDIIDPLEEISISLKCKKYKTDIDKLLSNIDSSEIKDLIYDYNISKKEF